MKKLQVTAQIFSWFWCECWENAIVNQPHCDKYQCHHYYKILWIQKHFFSFRICKASPLDIYLCHLFTQYGKIDVLEWHTSINTVTEIYDFYLKMLNSLKSQSLVWKCYDTSGKGGGEVHQMLQVEYLQTFTFFQFSSPQLRFFFFFFFFLVWCYIYLIQQASPIFYVRPRQTSAYGLNIMVPVVVFHCILATFYFQVK